jgi:5-dehydro-4-deoxyglucarate dehydratase
MLDGVLFFPITPFSSDDSVDHGALKEHLEHGLKFRPGGIFVACGTGEFHALSLVELSDVVTTAVATTAGRVPVYAGAGGALALAKEQVRLAESAGADGILLFPPYLVSSPQEGLVAYVRAIAGATSLPVIVYHRANARFTEASAVEVARIDNVAGLKDGAGDLDLMARIVRAVKDELAATGKDFQFFNGLPTAEASQQAYRAIGVTLYSSATFAFAPELAVAFYQALGAGDEERLGQLSREFFHPLVRLRDSVPGYAVALVKAGAELGGIRSGHVRPPLTDASEQDREELKRLLAAGRALLG